MRDRLSFSLKIALSEVKIDNILFLRKKGKKNLIVLVYVMILSLVPLMNLSAKSYQDWWVKNLR